MTPPEMLSLVLTGLVAGAIGGLVGVGGSIIIIPVLTLLLDRNQHLSQASAMIINILVAAASVLQHHRAGAIRWDLAAKMLPFGLVFVLVGVEASNHLDGVVLMRVYGAFLVYVVVSSALKLRDDRTAAVDTLPPMLTWPRVGAVGGAMGVVAGLLGIGGAPVSIPLLQRCCHLPLRQAIATTSAVMVVTAAIGAARKNQTLAVLTDANGDTLGLSVSDSLTLALWLAPTAVLGALIGARGTHVLPVRWVRVAFILLMIWASAKMLGLF